MSKISPGIAVAGLLLLAFLAGACGTESGKTTISRGSADIIGTITAVQSGGGEGIIGTFDLEVKKADAPADEYVISVGDDAPVYRHAGEEIGDLEEVGFGTLQAGQKVEIWITGPVAESFPMQAQADFIVISGMPED